MFLEKKEIGLASKSPRRLELLQSIGFECIVHSPDIDEKRKADESILDYIQRNALEKNEASQNYFKQEAVSVVISADTIVCLAGSDGQRVLLEKPRDKKEARRMLKLLSGRSHQVYTAYCLADLQSGSKVANTIQTNVHFRQLSDDEIDSYVKTDEPYDKAGGYGAQGFGSVFIDKFEGSYTNVVGLPLTAVWLDWQQLGKSC